MIALKVRLTFALIPSDAESAINTKDFKTLLMYFNRPLQLVDPCLLLACEWYQTLIARYL